MDDATLKAWYREREQVPPPDFARLSARPRPRARLRPMAVATVAATAMLAVAGVRWFASAPDAAVPSAAELMAWTPASDALLPTDLPSGFTLSENEGLSP